MAHSKFVVWQDVSADLPQFSFFALQVLSGPHENFHYVIGDPATRRAAVVDPAFNVDRLLAMAGALGYQVDTAWLTHAHWDHIGGLDDAVRLGVKNVIVGRAAEKAPEVQAAKRDGATIRALRRDTNLALGELSAKALTTPGHQPEALSYVVADEALLGGDTLFIDTCGRTDFPGGDTDAMFSSMERIRQLDDELVLLPGHDYAEHKWRRLGDQKSENPALATTNREPFGQLHCLSH